MEYCLLKNCSCTSMRTHTVSLQKGHTIKLNFISMFDIIHMGIYLTHVLILRSLNLISGEEPTIIRCAACISYPHSICIWKYVVIKYLGLLAWEGDGHLNSWAYEREEHLALQPTPSQWRRLNAPVCSICFSINSSPLLPRFRM